MRSGLLRRFTSVAIFGLLLTSLPLFAQDFKKEVIYQIITDRFFDGDPANNDPPQSKGMYDPTKTNWQAYWGGDLAGIEAKLPYLHDMGVTALWISPPVDNSNRPWMGPEGKPVPYLFAPYHGYGARDFKRIDEHFGSAENDWKAFDSMVAAAHKLGMKIIVDFSPNDTNLINTGEFGTVYDDGKLLGNYADDTKHLYHHNGPVTDWHDRYQIQYHNVYDLADFDHMNPIVDRYIKEAITRFEDHGVDAFRIDAVKHMSWGWVYSLADTARAHRPAFVFAEWFQEGLSDSMYPDSVKFSNNSGIPLLDYPLALATREVFANDKGFKLICKVLAEQDRNFAYPRDLVTFVDNHDIPRLLSVNNNPNRLNEATAFVLTARGIPIVYYGDEQYLHNDTNKGLDPYTRPWMSSYDENSKGFKLVQQLTALRKSNDALAYGTMRTLWADDDTYVFERKFGGDVVLVAINKNEKDAATARTIQTVLPVGEYSDVLHGLLGGGSLQISGENAASGVTVGLPPHSVSVWQSRSEAKHPEAGSIEPFVGEADMNISIAGENFGHGKGKVRFGDTEAQIVRWTETEVTARVPKLPSGSYPVTIADDAGDAAAPLNFTVHQARLIPVTFTVQDVPALKDEEQLYLTGNMPELGMWKTSKEVASGPFLCPKAPECCLDISVPAGASLDYRYFILAKDGTVRWQETKNHPYSVPTSGTGGVKNSVKP
jgi:glycosidase